MLKGHFAVFGLQTSNFQNGFIIFIHLCLKRKRSKVHESMATFFADLGIFGDITVLIQLLKQSS